MRIISYVRHDVDGFESMICNQIEYHEARNSSVKNCSGPRLITSCALSHTHDMTYTVVCRFHLSRVSSISLIEKLLHKTIYKHYFLHYALLVCTFGWSLKMPWHEVNSWFSAAVWKLPTVVWCSVPILRKVAWQFCHMRTHLLDAWHWGAFTAAQSCFLSLRCAWYLSKDR